MVFSDDTLLARYNKRAAEAGESRVEPRQKKPRSSPGPAGGDLNSSGVVSSDPSRKGKVQMVGRGVSPTDGVPTIGAGPTGSSSSRDPALGSHPICSSSSARAPRSRPRRGNSAAGGGVGTPAAARSGSSRSPSGAVPRGRHLGPLRDHPPSSSRAKPPSSSRANPPSSSRANPPSSSRANPPSPSRASVGLEGNRYDPRWSFSKFDSAFDDASIAREVVRGACLPVDRAQMKSGPFREFTDQAFCSAIRHLHEVEMLVEAASSFWSEARSGDRKAEALKKGLGEAQAKLGEAEARARVAESRLGDTRGRLLEMESEQALSRSALQASEARANDLASELNRERHENNVLKLKLQQSEDRERIAAERAETAVERFRQSAEYRDELAEEAVDGLIRGFDDFRMQVSVFCPQFDFSNLRPRLCAADYRIPSEEEGFEEDFSPEVSPVVSAEAGPGAPSEVAGGVTPDVDPVILPEAAVEATAVEATAVEAIAEATVAGSVSAATSEVVPEAAVAADPEAASEAPVVAESVTPIVDVGE